MKAEPKLIVIALSCKKTGFRGGSHIRGSTKERGRILVRNLGLNSVCTFHCQLFISALTYVKLACNAVFTDSKLGVSDWTSQPGSCHSATWAR